MSYEKTIWKNREVEKPRTFTLQNNPDGTITLIPAEGQVIETGTPIIATNMNKIEDGLEAIHATVDAHVDKSASALESGHIILDGVTIVTGGDGKAQAKLTPALYFGDRTDGVLNTIGDVSFPSDIDGLPIVKHFTGLTINQGHKVTVSNRCKGLMIYVDGDCVINGELSMTARGASAVGEDATYIHNDDAARKYASLTNFWLGALTRTLPASSDIFPIPAVGAAGGPNALNTTQAGADGSAGVNGQCGGGGAGSLGNPGGGTVTNGAGAAGTAFSGGAGGGSAFSHDTRIVTAENGGINGGKGGNANSSYSARPVAGGAGNPGGAGYSAGVSGETGTGGLIFLIVKGNLTIGPSGIISSNGANGGGSAYGNGGGSGGGSINILYGGEFVNNGTIQANGGLGGTVYSYRGGNGGAGSIRSQKIAV